MLLGCDLGLDPALKSTAGDDLLHVRGNLADLLLPRGAIRLGNDDFGAANIPDQPPAGTAGQELLILERLAETLYKCGQFDTEESIVDAVAAEDVAEATGNDERNLLRQDGSRSLLS